MPITGATRPSLAETNGNRGEIAAAKVGNLFLSAHVFMGAEVHLIGENALRSLR
jgi:hypothetical protein